MFQNTLLPVPSGFTSTLKTEAADSLGTLVTSHMCAQYHKPKGYIEGFMAIKILNLDTLMLLLKNIHKEYIAWRFIS